MSGIAGLAGVDGSGVDSETVAAMTDAVAHHGGDGRGLWHGRNAGLGHQLFRTTPEATNADRPVKHDGVVVTADLRLDNRAELRSELAPSASESVADSQLLAAAYERWGRDCPQHLLGAFAFAAWDTDREELFLARDHMGVRPLYYYAADGVVAFGTQPRALWPCPAVPRRLDEVRIGDYLAEMMEDERRTFYEDVRRLPPAHALYADGSGVETWEYWALDPARTLSYGSDDAYARRFRELFTEAVRCRMRRVGPLASMLSGGLDSSSVSCAARDLATEPVVTVSGICPDVPESDESEYIRAVFDQDGFDPRLVRIDTRSPLEDLDERLSYFDRPWLFPNTFVQRAVCRTAAASGARVVFSGFDGDTTVSHGMGYPADLARGGRLLALRRELSGLAENFDRSRRELLRGRVIGPLAPDLVTETWRRLRGADDRTVPPLVDDGFGERIGLRQRIEAFDAEDRSAGTIARSNHYDGLTSGWLPFTLEVDAVTGAETGVELRYPFFDKRLIEFCLALPAEQKIRRGWTRYVLRKGLGGSLPTKVRQRGGKSNIGHNMVRQLATRNGDLLERTTASPQYVDDFINSTHLENEYNQLRENRPIDSGSTLTKTALLEEWFERHDPGSNEIL